ncbi:hypothetical protein ACFHW2_25565 [Actinomadura sp. LOL_016]|uniref:hypothetical protein n=1 Tax=unclassified Actinomadura TaxID=2626254 RepID=UPI003A803AB8
MFATDDDLPSFSPGTLIVDVSRDAGTGFEWARPATFTDPRFTVGHDVHLYGVDRSPSYLWDSATWEISQALIPHLASVLAGPTAWDADATIRRAIEIRDGVVQNPAVLSFQRRSSDYPHASGRSAWGGTGGTRAVIGPLRIGCSPPDVGGLSAVMRRVRWGRPGR